MPKPRIETEPMPPPPHLTGAAAEIWPVVLRERAAEGWLTADTLPLIQRYCIAFGRWREAEAAIAAEGAVVEAPKTKVKMVNPWLSISRNAAAEMSRLERELKISPARRAWP